MSLALKPNHAAVKAYYDTLHQFGQLHIDHEGAVSNAFGTLLEKCGRRATPKLTLVPQYRIERARSSVIVDGAMLDTVYHLPYGYCGPKSFHIDRSQAQFGTAPRRATPKTQLPRCQNWQSTCTGMGEHQAKML